MENTNDTGLVIPDILVESQPAPQVFKALTIAGSDSGGGAGIQADLRTFAALGVYGSSVVTSITAQNSLGVKDTLGVQPAMVEKQIDAVLGDIGTGAVKTGMLYNEEIINVVADQVKNHQVPCLIVDPVMCSTSGHELLNAAGVDVLREKLLPLTNIITPNVDEASVLAGFSIKNETDIITAARQIFMMGPDIVIITGVRQGERCIDFCYDNGSFYTTDGPWVDTSNTHGTGCSFSAAITAFIAKGAKPREAIDLAKRFVTTGLKYSYPIGDGKGPLNHMAPFFPGHMADDDVLELRYKAFSSWGTKIDMSPYPILNVIIGGPLSQGKDYAELTRMMIKNGARLIQLREKEGDTRQLVDIATRMCKICHEHNALFVVNDRVDVALASGADGVHIGQDDLSPKMARAILGPEKIIGVSAIDITEARAAIADGADYLGVGPAYPTTSKECKNDAGGS
ncbi:MAG: bifunctional hydroxymethylpyrimidine kinase/phosphomethylpyrimidine kinase, partial [Syntrophomonadaceae bacterium]